MNRIAIHGLGYVGLTAAVHWARAGWTVYAHDLDNHVIDALRAGTPRAGDFLAYLNEEVGRLVDKNLILPTHTFGDTIDCEVHSIAIPTEKAGVPWDEGVLKLLKQLDRALAHVDGATILVESTLQPGTMDKHLANSVRTRSSVTHIAVCPRRDWFADAERNLETLERAVGGVTPEATRRAVELLSIVTKAKIHEVGYREAEFTKALENAWLHALVMLPTELAMNCPNVNIAEVTRVASTHWRLPSVFLGAGCGGRCVPIATKYLLGAAGPGGLLEAVDTTERHIRVAVAEAIARRLPRNKPRPRVLIMGAAYRPSFRDAGLSPGLGVAKYLRNDFGIECDIVDPMWSSEALTELTGLHVPTVLHSTTQTIQPSNYGAIFFATAHPQWLDLVQQFNSAEVWRGVHFVMDANGVWVQYAELLASFGVEYKQVGGVGWR